MQSASNRGGQKESQRREADVRGADKRWLQALVGQEGRVSRNWDGALRHDIDDHALQIYDQEESLEQEIRRNVRRILENINEGGQTNIRTKSATCEQHANIDLHNTNWPVPLGRLDWILIDEACSLCHIVRSVLLDEAQDFLKKPGAWTNCQLLPFDTKYDVVGASGPQNPTCQRPIWHLLFGGEDVAFRNSINNKHVDIRIHPAMISEKESEPLQVRLLKCQFNSELAKSWLRQCATLHGRSCQDLTPSSNASRAQCLRVIDVNHRRSLLAGQDCEYVALSYVWGGDEMQTFKLRKQACRTRRWVNASVELPPRGGLPATIEDAIDVTRLLGFNYLWVDVLCIFQDDQGYIRAQISQMNEIYSRATLTIVDAGDGNAQTGLVGAPRRPRRILQHFENIANTTYANVLPELKEVMSKSTWDTRAWTFQERLLSKRCLIFTRYQVYFECTGASWNENLFSETISVHSPDSSSRYYKLLYDPETRLGGSRRLFGLYSDIVGGFSKRKVTMETDILNAFQGIQKYLTYAYKVPFLCGLPLSLLPLALLWVPTEPLSMRHCPTRGDTGSNSLALADQETFDFPTWSWVSWTGAVQYCVEKLGSLTMCREFQFCSESGSDFGKPQCDSKSNTQSAWNELCADHLSMHGGVLRFSTALTTFKLVWADHHVQGHILAACDNRQGPHSILRYALITDKMGKHAGEILLDRGHPLLASETVESESHHFILLGQTKDAERRFWRDGYGGRCTDEYIFHERPTYPGATPHKILFAQCDPWSYYRVMQVVFRGEYSYRIAVGSIHIEAWHSQNPAMTDIMLA